MHSVIRVINFNISFQEDYYAVVNPLEGQEHISDHINVIEKENMENNYYYSYHN